MPEVRTRRIPIVAQDPSVRRDGKILTTRVAVPWEELEGGPAGHRVHVVDYDAATQTMYEPARIGEADVPDPAADDDILEQPGFHALNVYALGRRVGWGFRAHQLKVVPHAFQQKNAFYARDAEALLFGYYQGREGPVFTCLSHDVVVHETTHALLDGLRSRFMEPSSPDQAAFHEGFADVIALLSVFSLGDVLRYLVDRDAEKDAEHEGLIKKDAVEMDALMRSVLLGLAEQMGPGSGQARADALRRSVQIEPDEGILRHLEFQESHRRGEILVAAIMRAFVDVWTRRLKSLGAQEGTEEAKYLDLGRVVEEGATIADLLLTMAIRALDYTPPIHLEFRDYLSALVTADTETRPDDSRYELRGRLLEWFGRYGISPASGEEGGIWKAPDTVLAHEGVRFGSLQSDPIEMFRLVWANRRDLRLDPRVYTRVASVRPCVRASPEDGLLVRETVAECLQYVEVPASELGSFGLTKPDGMADETEVVLQGGSTLILDEYGRLKYEIHDRLVNENADAKERKSAQERLEYLWAHGAFDRGSSFAARLATLHRLREAESRVYEGETW